MLGPHPTLRILPRYQLVTNPFFPGLQNECLVLNYWMANCLRARTMITFVFPKTFMPCPETELDNFADDVIFLANISAFPDPNRHQNSGVANTLTHGFWSLTANHTEQHRLAAVWPLQRGRRRGHRGTIHLGLCLGLRQPKKAELFSHTKQTYKYENIIDTHDPQKFWLLLLGNLPKMVEFGKLHGW